MAKNQQEKRKINFKEFELQKLKLKPDGVDFYWKIKGEAGKHFREYMATPHEDLINSLNALKSIFAKRLGLEEVTERIRKELSEKDIIKKEELFKIQIEQIERCTITGLHYAGEDQLKRIGIIGQVKVPVYGSFSLAAPGVNLVGERLGYEEDLIELCDTVCAEAYNMLYLGKVAPVEEQEELFNENYINDEESDNKEGSD